VAGKVRHLVNRSGRYHSRLVVPKDLSYGDLTLLVRETSLKAVFGRAYTNQADMDGGPQIIVGALKSSVGM
jgi:hypothetical protein